MPNVNGIPIILQYGTKAQLDSISLQLAELGFATDTKELFIGDGNDKILVNGAIIDDIANRPVSGVAGKFFIDQNTGESYVDDGNQWILIGRSQLSDMTGDLDDIADGTTYVRIFKTEVINGGVFRLNDGSIIITANDIHTHMTDANIHVPLNDASHDTNHVLSANQIDVRIAEKFQGLDYQNSIIDFYDNSTGLPTSPSIGDRYIALSTANGWTKNNIYEWDGSQWDETVPNIGFRLTNEADDIEYAYNSVNNWVAVPNATAHNNLGGLEGTGLNGHYIHLDQDQYTKVTQYATDALDGLMSANDHQKLPSSNQKDALAGTTGTPSDINRYVTETDPRMTDSRPPTAHASTHKHGGDDEIATSVPAAYAIPKANAQGNLNIWITEIRGGTFV